MLESIGSYITSILIVQITLLIIYMKWSLTYWKKKNIPYLEPSFPFGNFQNPLTNKFSIGYYFQQFYNEFKKRDEKGGGVYSYCTPIFVTADPTYNKHILLKDFQYFQARGFYSNAKHQPISANLMTADGEKWRTLRAKLTPTFTSAKIKNMYHIMIARGKTLEGYIAKYAAGDNPADIRDCVSRFSADIIGSCAFGIECNSFEDTKFYYLLKKIFSEGTGFFKQSFCAAMPNVARFLRIPLFPEAAVAGVIGSINETVKFRTENDVSKNDFLQMLIEMNAEDVLDMDEIRAQALLFFVAGYETSATTLTFSLFELADNQDVQDKLRQEIRDILSKHNDVLSYEAVQKMKYLQAVMDETLRKYPPIPTLKRKCVKDYTIPGTNFVIEKGRIIFVPTLGFHYDPEYFPDPHKFDPTRFLEENASNITPFSYLPFGDGPRNCIGDRFGKLEVKIGLISLVNKYKFSVSSQMKLPLEYFTGLPSTKQDILLDVNYAD